MPGHSYDAVRGLLLRGGGIAAERAHRYKLQDGGEALGAGGDDDGASGGGEDGGGEEGEEGEAEGELGAHDGSRLEDGGGVSRQGGVGIDRASPERCVVRGSKSLVNYGDRISIEAPGYLIVRDGKSVGLEGLRVEDVRTS